ncbi:hypothetical protein ACFWN7_02770 [Agromyces sp. NPDC058484]|uniref:hypothetical protein n=1 Tax=Agromyces sp. NPDC058484 TaxID=3346524 RepID=UPI003647E934
MTRTIRASALPAAAIILALTLTGCVGQSSPRDTAAPSTQASEPSPAPSTVPAEPAIASIVVRPEQLDLEDGSGVVVRTLSYDLAAEEFVAELSEVFGGEPTVEEYPGSCCESRPATRYRWDEFQVSDDHMGHFADDDHSAWIPDEGPDYADMNLEVQLTGPTVRGITMTTAPGFEVGDDVGELAGRLGEPYDVNGYVEVPVETGAELGPSEVAGKTNGYSVVIWKNGAEGFRLVAPVNIGVARN